MAYLGDKKISLSAVYTKLVKCDACKDIQMPDVYTEQQTANLFNKDSSENVDGYLLSFNGAVAVSGYSYSHPISVEVGKTYNVKVSGDVHAQYSVTLYNVSGEIVKDFRGSIDTTTVDGYHQFVIPDGVNARYMRCSYKTALINEFMVAEGESVPTEYERFGIDIRLSEKMIEGIESQYNPLYRKKISLNGDSICYGAGSTGGYGALIAENNNMNLQNIGVSGATITAETYQSDGTVARHWICRTIANMDADADYAIVEGGVNDAGSNVPLGAISSGFSSTLDDTTFYGAFESMLKQLLLRFHGKKVGYIAVHQMTANYCATNDEATSYYYASKKCCEKWGVPFLDLNTQCPPWGLFVGGADETLKALRNQYTYNGDGWHPNEEGYKKYYVPKIEAWLKTL